MESEDRQEANACEICGSQEEIGKYQLDCETVIRCRDHQGDGISLEAEEIYWRRRASSDQESNQEDKDQ